MQGNSPLLTCERVLRDTQHLTLSAPSTLCKREKCQNGNRWFCSEGIIISYMAHMCFLKGEYI